MKYNKIFVLAFAAIILAVVASGTASASTVWFQNSAVAQLYDDSNNGGGFNAAWVSYTPEHVYVSGGDTLAWASTSYDYSTKVSTCSILNFYICNDLNPYISQDTVGNLNPTYGSATTTFDSKPVSATSSTNFQISVGYYPSGSGYIYNANPMKTSYVN